MREEVQGNSSEKDSLGLNFGMGSIKCKISGERKSLTDLEN